MIKDPEVQWLAALADGLKGEYQTDEDLSWSLSPFGWIRGQSSRRKGAIGEKLVAGWCAARDINVLRSPDAAAPRSRRPRHGVAQRVASQRASLDE